MNYNVKYCLEVIVMTDNYTFDEHRLEIITYKKLGMKFVSKPSVLRLGDAVS